MQVQAQKWLPRPQQTHININVRSDWSDSDDDKDNQARGRPDVVDITSDQELDIDKQPSTSNPSTSTPLRKLNTYPKVLSFGRCRGKFPLANWTSVARGHGCRLLSRCDISRASPLHEEPTVERNLAIVAPTNRVQTYEGDLVPSKSRKDLANWSWVRLGNTRPMIINNNNNRTEQRQWQRPNSNTDDRALDKTGDHADPNSIEGDAIQSDKERSGLEELE